MNRFYPFLWGGVIFIFGEALTFAVVLTAQDFLEASRSILPEVSLQVALIYFFVMVIAMGVVLLLIPIARLRLVLKVFFALLFFWGALIILGLVLPVPVAVAIALIGCGFWFFKPKIWLHNLLLIVTLVGTAVVFGALLAPWTVLLLLLVISVYDILAVSFGYMLWMTKKLFEADTLPAFVLPLRMAYWMTELKQSDLRKLSEEKTAAREFAVLGGGDIGFPLLLVVSVFFNYGLRGSVVVALTTLGGLALAFLIQQVILKGKPLPALGPISFGSFVGYLITRFWL